VVLFKYEKQFLCLSLDSTTPSAPSAQPPLLN